MRMLAAALAAIAFSLTATDAVALTTVNCSTDASAYPTVAWDGDTSTFTTSNGAFISQTAELHASNALQRSCGREYRGTLTIRGSIVKETPIGPAATIARKVENGCQLSGSDSGSLTTPLSYPNSAACGAHVEFTWTLNGVQTTRVEHQGCQGYYTLPSESSVTTTSATGCVYPPENNASPTLQVPALFVEENYRCGGWYDVSWEHVPGATRYVLMRKLANQQTDTFTTLYDGPNNYFTTFVSSGAQRASIWVRACAGAECGFHSGPKLISYYGQCQ